MTIEQSLDTLLKADTALTTITGQRIYWIKADQLITFPYLVYTIVSDTDEQFAFADNDTGRALVQFDIVSETKAGKAALYRVRNLLRNLRVIGTLNVKTCLPSQIREQYNPDTNKFVFSIDMEITFSYS
jgi:hypothetical protein